MLGVHCSSLIYFAIIVFLPCITLFQASCSIAVSTYLPNTSGTTSCLPTSLILAMKVIKCASSAVGWVNPRSHGPDASLDNVLEGAPDSQDWNSSISKRARLVISSGMPAFRPPIFSRSILRWKVFSVDNNVIFRENLHSKFILQCLSISLWNISTKSLLNPDLESLCHVLAAWKRKREIIQGMQIMYTFHNLLFVRRRDDRRVEIGQVVCDIDTINNRLVQRWRGQNGDLHCVSLAKCG